MSTVPGGWGEMSGTSMATPHVAASVALLHQADPALTADQLIATLKATADDIGTPGPDNQYGSGEVDVYRAVESVLGPPPTTRIAKASAGARDLGQGQLHRGRHGCDRLPRSRRRRQLERAAGEPEHLVLAEPPAAIQVQVQAIAPNANVASGYVRGIRRA